MPHVFAERQGHSRSASGARACALGLAVCAAAVLAPAPAQAAPMNLVRHVGLLDQPQTASVTLTLSGAVPAHIFRLSGPERLVIDLPHTRRLAAWPKPTRTGLVRELRSSRQAHGVRVVLELRENAAVRWQWLAAEHSRAARLRVELLAAEPASGAVSAQAPSANQAEPLLAQRRSSSQASPEATPGRAIRVAPASGAQHTVIVAVDAGHGGMDPGAIGPDGTHEKNVTLAIALALAARIDATPGMHAVLTRDGDYFVPLPDRWKRAQAAHADLFVSIHADSVRNRLVSGASVYILSERGETSVAARELTQEDNAAADPEDGSSPVEQASGVRPVLIDLAQDASVGQSAEAAQDVLNAMDRVGAVRKREVQRAAFVVLKSFHIPSMLIETAYISNPSDERRLRSPEQQRRLAAAIYRGIAAYFHQYPPTGSLFARAHAVASSASS